MADKIAEAAEAKDTNKKSFKQQILAEMLAEFLGTAILMVFGMGSVAQYVFGTGSSDQIRWSWGLGVTFGVYVSGNVSGGHINPAVTFTLCLFKRHPWKRLLPYWFAQYLGSFTAACLVYGVYIDALNSYKDGARTLETAGIFSTYPQSYLSWGNALGDQVFGTALLVLLVFALIDPYNVNPPPGYRPVLIGLVVTAIGMTFGHNCGYAINPARDLAPRIFTAIAGWGSQVFSHGDYMWFWIPVVGPHIGSILGAAVYELCINKTLPCVSPTCRSKFKAPEVENAYVETTTA